MQTQQQEAQNTSGADPIDTSMAAFNALYASEIGARIAAGENPISRTMGCQMLLLIALAHVSDGEGEAVDSHWADLLAHACLTAIVGRSGPVAEGLDSYWHARTLRERDRRSELEEENRSLRARICALETTGAEQQAA